MIDDLSIPLELYESEISFTVSCFWYNGFDVAVGTAPNFAETGHVNTCLEACRWLKQSARRHYPQSAFAKKYVHYDGQGGHGLHLV